MMAVKNPECPICGDTFEDGRGLSGHLQFKHGLSGDEHEEKLDKGMERGQKRETLASEETRGKTIRERELELKGELSEIEEERKEVSTLLGMPLTDADKEKREELNQREKEIREELQELDSGW